MKTLFTSALVLGLVTLTSFRPASNPTTHDVDVLGEKIALVSVYCSKQVDASQFGNSLAGAINTLANSEDFDLRPFVDKLHERIQNGYLENLDYDFIPEAEVLSAPGYDKSISDGSLIKAEYLLKPEGYVGVHTMSKKSQQKALDVFPDVDGIMMIGIDYTLVKTAEVMGFGTAKVQANINLKIVDRKGKKMFKVLVYQKSSDNIKFALGGVFNTDELMPLVEDATNNALERLDEKILKKASKKK